MGRKKGLQVPSRKDHHFVPKAIFYKRKWKCAQCGDDVTLRLFEWQRKWSDGHLVGVLSCGCARIEIDVKPEDLKRNFEEI